MVLHKKRCLLSIVFHNERNKTSICKRIFLKLDLFMGVICDYFHANVYYHISMKKYMIQSERLDLLLHECEGIIQTFQVLNNGISKSVFYAYVTVHIRHLREKLNDTSDTPQYIKTIWGVGYKI